MTSPTVFVSYSHDSQEHKQWVLEFATRLRNSGVDAILDQWDLGPGGDLPHFMELSISRSARVIMVCTDRYDEKANAGHGGVGYEKMIVTADLLKTIGSTRVIPVVSQAGLAKLPTFLGSKLFVDLSTADRFETGMDQLLRDILNAPLFVKPPIGSAPFHPVGEKIHPTQPNPVNQLLEALLRVYELTTSLSSIPASRVRTAMGTSKLFFDHSLDLGVKEGFITTSSSREMICIEEKARAALLKMGPP